MGPDSCQESWDPQKSEPNQWTDHWEIWNSLREAQLAARRLRRRSK